MTEFAWTCFALNALALASYGKIGLLSMPSCKKRASLLLREVTIIAADAPDFFVTVVL
jgi:hypothetical protein